jgi:hypothetical protein
MSKSTPASKLKSVKTLAAEMGLTHARISQIRVKAGIDGIIIGNARMFSPSEVAAIKRFPRRVYERKS